MHTFVQFIVIKCPHEPRVNPVRLLINRMNVFSKLALETIREYECTRKKENGTMAIAIIAAISGKWSIL